MTNSSLRQCLGKAGLSTAIKKEKPFLATRLCRWDFLQSSQFCGFTIQSLQEVKLAQLRGLKMLCRLGEGQEEIKWLLSFHLPFSSYL